MLRPSLTVPNGIAGRGPPLSNTLTRSCAADLKQAFALLRQSDRAFVFAATPYALPVYRAFRRDGDGLAMIFPEHFETRSQDLPEALHDAGQFYWGRPSDWLAGTRIFGDRSDVVVLPRWRVQDIDDEDDWKRAEMLFALNARSSAPEA